MQKIEDPQGKREKSSIYIYHPEGEKGKKPESAGWKITIFAYFAVSELKKIFKDFEKKQVISPPKAPLKALQRPKTSYLSMIGLKNPFFATRNAV